MEKIEHEKVPGTSSKLQNQSEKTVAGKKSKYDKGLSVLEQYDLSSENTFRGRGTLLCQTLEGLKMIQPYTGSEKHLEKINRILKHLQNCGHHNLDLICPNKENALISTDSEGYTYLVKNWFPDRECDVRSEKDLLECMGRMARLHKDMFLQVEDTCKEENLLVEYEKHNQQLKKIRFYIRHRKQKNAFEYLYLNSVEYYLERGVQAYENLKDSSYEKKRNCDVAAGSICHGMCNQHNFLMTPDGATLVNFGDFFVGNHMADVAQFLRKIMEKQNWNPMLAGKMLDRYDAVFPFDDTQWEQLKVRMAYPEKYWKIANFYYNNNKAFLPEKNMEKLELLIHQEQKWINFYYAVFGEKS